MLCFLDTQNCLLKTQQKLRLPRMLWGTPDVLTNSEHILSNKMKRKEKKCRKTRWKLWILNPRMGQVSRFRAWCRCFERKKTQIYGQFAIWGRGQQACSHQVRIITPRQVWMSSPRLEGRKICSMLVCSGVRRCETRGARREVCRAEIQLEKPREPKETFKELCGRDLQIHWQKS